MSGVRRCQLKISSYIQEPSSNPSAPSFSFFVPDLSQHSAVFVWSFFKAFWSERSSVCNCCMEWSFLTLSNFCKFSNFCLDENNLKMPKNLRVNQSIWLTAASILCIFNGIDGNRVFMFGLLLAETKIWFRSRRFWVWYFLCIRRVPNHKQISPKKHNTVKGSNFVSSTLANVI